VMVEPLGCPSNCIYCPTYPDTPKSYTPESPAVIRARHCNYNAAMQVHTRLKSLASMGHAVDKIELIIMGGTFLAYPENYQYEFVKRCYDALNGTDSTSLQQAQSFNETARHRCIGLCIETRPDWCDEAQVKKILEFGTTRVELGVQAIDNEIYSLVKRGHQVKDVIQATRLLKQYGLKVHYHWMPGLPGSNTVHDLAMTQRLFSDPDFRPDGLKLYPTLVVAGTELENWYLQGRYKPYSMEQLVDLMVEIKSGIPGYVRISRVMRDIPTKFIIAGCKDLALRSSLKKKLEHFKVSCKCIRCREYGHRSRDGWKSGKPLLQRYDYMASGGCEIFLSFEDEQETIFGLLRLRINRQIPPKGHAAIVREIHVYGSEVPLGEHKDDAIQHQGLGVKLVHEAERISREEFGASCLAVISGVGARNYFRNEFGYRLENSYMVKDLLN
jgi:elongator complex protein 3